MSTIGSGSNIFSSTQGVGGTRHHRPDPAKMVDEIFSRLDTKGQGYLEKSDLQTAFTQASSSNGASVDEVFSSLDGNNDGKITKDEMSSGLKKLADELDSQFTASRLAGAMGNMPPPPPPPESDAGFTKDQLSTLASQAASTDSKRADLMNSIVANFDKADTDGDGKVSLKEAMAYDQTRQSATATSSSSVSGTADSESVSARVLRQIMQLMASYGAADAAASSSSLSTSA